MADSRVGHFRESIEISPLAGGATHRVDALVDTGATYTWIPRDILDTLGIVAGREQPFILADGQQVTYPVAWIRARLRGRADPTLVVFGEPGSEPILGVVTLEEHGLGVDPVNRRLIPVPGLLKSGRAA